MFKKAPPSRDQFALLPEDVYHGLGAARLLPAMVLSRVYGGQVWNEDHEYTTTSGRTFTIPAGTSWLSAQTLQEDIVAATGYPYTRRQITYAIQTLEPTFITQRTQVLPETRGRYGQFFRTVDLSHGTVDPLMIYRVMTYDDPDAFVWGVGKTFKKSAENAVKPEAWMREVARRGVDSPAFTTIGRWDAREKIKDPDAQVYVPWLTFDIDRIDLFEAFWETRQIVDDLRLIGIPLRRIFVSFSGAKGFHVQVSMRFFGSPVFHNSAAAKSVIRQVQLRITEVTTDPCVSNPLNLIRLTGSTHADTGIRKITWDGVQFIQTGPEAAFAQARNNRRSKVMDDRMDEEVELLKKAFAASAASTAQDIAAQRRRRGRSKIGPKTRRILDGVREHEIWDDEHAGRDKAAFNLACFLLEHGVADVAEHLGTDSRDVTEIMLLWDEQNEPPLGRRKIMAKIRSAEQTIKRSK